MGEGIERIEGGHVLLVCYPAQGHLNPMLQFGKRLASHGLWTTLATTRFTIGSSRLEPGPVKIESISDGFDEGGFNQAGNVSAYLAGLESAGSKSLEKLISTQKALDRPVQVVVYDTFLPWVVEIGKRLGLVCAAFLTQSCAVDAIYGHVFQGRIKVRSVGPVVSLPGLPSLEPADLPSVITEPEPVQHPAYTALLLSQFSSLEKADLVFINSFYELEPEETDWMKLTWRVKTIGPTVPSMFLDKQIEDDSSYGFNFWTPETNPCMDWLNSKPYNSVVYLSFGSLATLEVEQMEELACGLRDSNKHFMWVVRSSELSKLPTTFIVETSVQGLVVSWAPQLEVLAHGAVGCFVTHCGWNSTLEGLSLGVPMVAMPQWTDQPMNAKYIEDIWKVGVRAKKDEKGIVGREEVVRCLKEVMEGQRGEEIKRNASKWKHLARNAVGGGGSSDKNIAEFVAKYCS